MKRGKVPLPIAIGVALGIAVLLNYGRFTPSTFSTRELETALQNAARNDPIQAGLFELFQEEFPDEYEAMLEEVAARVNSARPGTSALEGEVFHATSNFAMKLRQDNAHYLNTAPTEDVRAISMATFTMMESLAYDRDLCVRFLVSGGSTFSPSDMERVDMSKLAEVAVANFRAMAAGRDHPVSRTPATQQEIQNVLRRWRTSADVTPGMVTALMYNDTSHVDYCAAQTSFQGFVARMHDAEGERVMVTLTALATEQ